MSALNLNKFKSLLNAAHKNKPVLLQMLHNMLSASEDSIVQLQHLARQQQRDALLQALHKIRGGYATLGAEQLAAACQQLERELEQNSPFAEHSLQDIIRLYRQTCKDIHAALQADAEQNSTADHIIDLQQLHKLLLQHNMQASDIVAASRDALTKQLPPAVAVQFFQRVIDLDFQAAAALLQPFLPQSGTADQ